MNSLPQRAAVEFVGTAFLLMAVVGSGIMAERLSPGDVGLQLLENAFATALALTALILAFGGLSGAHFNPVVTLFSWRRGDLARRDLLPYLGAQVLGACLGTVLANLMFDLPLVELSEKVRGGAGQWLGEVVATFGLVVVIATTVGAGSRELVAFTVGGYIAGAYFFTSSTSFANPAVTVARVLSDSFAGIAPASAPGFVAAQAVGLGLSLAFVGFVLPRKG